MKQLHILVILTVILGSWNLDASAQNVDFPDANLAAVVRTKLSLAEDADIPQTDLARITSLTGNRKGITNLEGLQHATGLTLLQLRGNPISDFTPISSLTNLTNLTLINTGFSNSDISILSPLTQLQYLRLGENEIGDLSALVNVISAKMPMLVSLSIDDNGFHDIAPLTALKDQLESLNLNDTQISSLGPLAEFTNLTVLSISRTGISNLEPLRNLVNLGQLFINDNQISDLEPLSGLTNLTRLHTAGNPFEPDSNPFESLGELTEIQFLTADTTYETQVGEMFPDLAWTRFYDPRSEPTPEPETSSPEPEPAVKQRRIIARCGLGWSPHSQYQHHGELPKVMIYALEFEYDPEGHGRYICKTIEIQTGDDSIENLAGWNLYLGTLYNPSHIPVTIPEEHSQITGRILRITPEMLGLETFPCNTVNGISHPLPGVQYVLKTDENILVDTAYSCFVWGQNAYTTVNGKNVESPRRISSAALREMEAPRLERYISNNIGVYITYMNIETFTWDRVVLSDWLLGSSEEVVVNSPNAPLLPDKKLTTTWGAIKKPPALRQRNFKHKPAR